MSVSMNSVKFSNISFTGNDDKRDAEKKAVTGGGAIAATATATRAKAAKSGFDAFNSAKQVSQGMKTFTDTAKTAQAVAKKSTGLWAKVCENAKWAKDAIIKWGSKFKNMKYVKPLVESRAFRFGAGALGYGFGAVTLISGLSDIAKVTSETAEKHFVKAA